MSQITAQYSCFHMSLARIPPYSPPSPQSAPGPASEQGRRELRLSPEDMATGLVIVFLLNTAEVRIAPIDSSQVYLHKHQTRKTCYQNSEV